MDLAVAAENTIAALVARIDALERAHSGRICIGIAGAPGSGKSTLSLLLHDALGCTRSVVVPMDGFHLSQSVIAGTPLADRRGAIDTFDAWGYLHLLRRIMVPTGQPIYAPAYLRSIEDPIAGAIRVPPSVPIVITEGNYLLVDEEPWRSARSLMAEVWFVETDEALRTNRLVQRHIEFGKTTSAAQAWVGGPDATNAAFIRSTRAGADHVVTW